MDVKWNTQVVNPQELIAFSRGDKDRLLKYLYQFQAIIPARIESLKESLAAKDRKKIRQLLHQMSPQLQFFGIMDVVQPINKLEIEYKSIPIKELTGLIDTILTKLRLAQQDVDSILEANF